VTRPEQPFVDECAVQRQRALLAHDVTRRLRPVCAGLHMSEPQFREVVRAIVDIKLGWFRRQLPS